ncbi:sulfotransferase family protein [Nitzschia inconspicua]|uniref:Sulfotransferase family protein n=1 Tax=Nitzschia inconspicua TaxID=303405 RepID=A0A9K3LZK9_9STRA|nr:sulfotransferase family protein [Nitzschia inconspicua]
MLRWTKIWIYASATLIVLFQYSQITDRKLELHILHKDLCENSTKNLSSAGFDAFSTHTQLTLPQYLINQAKERAQTFNATEAISKVKCLAVDHPVFRNFPKAYQPLPQWKEANFPDISIAGLQKAGTSHLYKILTSHENMTGFHPKIKEFHFGIPHLWMDISNLLLEPQQRNGRNITKSEQMATIQQFFFRSTNATAHIPLSAELDSKHANSKHLMTVNGFLDTVTVMMMRQYLQKTHDINNKVILILRDPADWLWASYNFWTHSKHHDLLKAARADWAESPRQYRSPELFHEMLLAGSDRFGPTAELIGKFRDRISNLFTRVIAAACRDSPSQVLVIKAEDMTPDRINTSQLMQRLADFLGVSLDGFDSSILNSFSNCGNKRGVDAKCSKASSAYAVAGNRSMMEESRDLVYLYFAEECWLWAKEFDIVYERCLEVSEKYNITHNM